jgi:putative FmdB family regulatory protein
MPLYEYRCSRCDHREEVLQRSSDKLVECRYCSPFLMDRMIGIPAIKFVGKGFHGTDYTRFGPKKKG